MVKLVSPIAGNGIIGSIADFFVRFSETYLAVAFGIVFSLFIIAFAIWEGLGINSGGKID